MNPNTAMVPMNVSLNGYPAAIAVGCVMLGFTTLGIYAMYKGYSMDFGALRVVPTNL